MLACAAGETGRRCPVLRRLLPLLSLLLAIAAASLLAGPAGAQVVPPPPPPPEQEEGALDDGTALAEWYVSTDGKAQGPFTLAQLRQMAADGVISGGTAVWKEGMAGWLRLREVPELAPVMAAVPEAEKTVKPPPVPDTQALLDKQAAAFIVGTWRLEGPYVIGTDRVYVVVEITYRSDGTYAGYQTLSSAANTPGVTAGRRGIFTVSGVDDTHFVMTYTDDGAQPQQSAFEVIDQNTIRNQNMGLLVYRVR